MQLQALLPPHPYCREQLELPGAKALLRPQEGGAKWAIFQESIFS